MMGKATVDVGPLLVDQLKEERSIYRRTFSFLMHSKKKGSIVADYVAARKGELFSHIDFGEPDWKLIKDNDKSKIGWINVNRDLFWSVML